MKSLWIGIVVSGLMLVGCGTPDPGDPGDDGPDGVVVDIPDVGGADETQTTEPGDKDDGAVPFDGLESNELDTEGQDSSEPDTSVPGADASGSFDSTPVTAGTWLEAPGNTGSGFKNANNAVNGVRGAGQSAGSMDVFSLGYTNGVDNFIVLSWGGATVRNGPGVDFVVFENGFQTGPNLYFMDLVVVMLSRDGVTYVPFPHDYMAQDETQYVAQPDVWRGFGGRYPIKYNVDTNPVDPFDHEASGGDPFDLDELPVDGGESQAIREEGFRYLKLVTAPTQINPDTGDFFVRDGMSNGADIDGVIARYVQE